MVSIIVSSVPYLEPTDGLKIYHKWFYCYECEIPRFELQIKCHKEKRPCEYYFVKYIPNSLFCTFCSKQCLDLWMANVLFRYSLDLP